jgi:CubicO group peptidase (beta-lactamase class C family)
MLRHPAVAAILGPACVGALPAGAPAQARDPLAAIDRYLKDELRRQRVPGFSVAVVRNGRLLFARGYGYANLEHRVRATDSTIYQSRSLGIQFTAALLLQLADSNLLSLDDPIRRWLPEGPPRWDSVTVRRLLTHTSGIPDYTDSVVDLHRDHIERGPARFKRLTLAHAGKNGDQLVRAFNEPVDLVILQHCHAVTPAVREVMGALAVRLGRRYCVIDGADTMRLLKAVGQWLRIIRSSDANPAGVFTYLS